ncbi:MAG: anti-sigma factor antagonist [Chlorobiaceae bacterium]|nr:anti-sigma factor antagonist [Chlorobiaceae bacterium]
MFNAKILDTGEIVFAGRLDASQVDVAEKLLEEVTTSRTLNFKELEYISSAGLGILLAHQKRLKETGHAMRLVNLNKHVKDIFILTGFDHIFKIE